MTEGNRGSEATMTRKEVERRWKDGISHDCPSDPCDFCQHTELARFAMEAMKRLAALDSKLDQVWASDSYRGQVMMAHVHGHVYSGPQVVKEQAAAKVLLAEWEREKP